MRGDGCEAAGDPAGSVFRSDSVRLSSQTACAGEADQRSVLALHQTCRVYTRKEIAVGLLDAIGWRADRCLKDQRLLEPAAGNGVFLRLVAERLMESLHRYHDPL